MQLYIEAGIFILCRKVFHFLLLYAYFALYGIAPLLPPPPCYLNKLQTAVRTLLLITKQLFGHVKVQEKRAQSAN